MWYLEDALPRNPLTQEAPIVRLRIASLRRVVKGDLRIEFVQQDLTSYGGLELLRRYFRLLDLHRRIRDAFRAYGLTGDYGSGRLVLLLVALWAVGGRRLEHLRYLAHDPLVARLCGLARIPSGCPEAIRWASSFEYGFRRTVAFYRAEAG